MLEKSLLFSALFAFALFYFFRWVFIERYSAEAAHIYAVLTALVCGAITYVTVIKFV
jgi:hypothetical protein